MVAQFMKVAPLPRLKGFSALLAVALTFSLIPAQDVSGSPNPKRTRTVRRTAKSKSQTRSARRGGSRSTKLRAHYTRRRGGLYVRVRDRRGRLRWRKVVATSVHGVGVHNYLTDSWTQPQGTTERASIDGGSEAAKTSPTPSASTEPTATPREHRRQPSPIRKISQHRQDRLRRAVTTPSPFQGEGWGEGALGRCVSPSR